MVFPNKMQVYHIIKEDGKQINFVSLNEMLELARKNILTEKNYVWKLGMKDWVKAGRVTELKPLFRYPPDTPEETKCHLFD
jgi:uncharacterized FlgJ-related protein